MYGFIHHNSSRYLSLVTEACSRNHTGVNILRADVS